MAIVSKNDFFTDSGNLLKARIRHLQQINRVAELYFNNETGTFHWSEGASSVLPVDTGTEAGSIFHSAGFFANDHKTEFWSALQRCFNLNVPVSGEYLVNGVDNQLVWLEIRMFPITGGFEGVTGVHGVVKDITALKVEQDRQQKQELTLRAFLDEFSETVVKFDPNGAIKYLNGSWVHLTGFSIETSLSRPIFDFFDGDDEAQLRNLLSDFPGSVSGQDYFHLNIVTNAGTKKRIKMSLFRKFSCIDSSVLISAVLTDLSDMDERNIQLEEQRLFYETILNNVPGDIVALDKNKKYLFVNKQSVTDDNNRKLIIGKTNMEYFKIRNLSKEIALNRDIIINQVLTTKEQYSFEERFDVDGHEKYYLRILKPILTNSGDVKALIGYGMDISELKQKQQIIKMQETAIASTMDGVALCDPKGVYYYMNQAHANIFRYDSPSELIGHSWRKIYDDREIHRIEAEVMPELIRTGKWSGETRGLSKDGSAVTQEITLTLLDEGNLICICRDISKLRSDAEEIRRLAIVTQKTNSIVIICNADGKIIWKNDSFNRILEYDTEEVIDSDIVDILCGGETDVATRNKIKGWLQSKESCSGELLNYSKSGNRVWLYVTITPILDHKGDVQNFIVVENDITTIKEAEENLKMTIEKERELNRFKSQFVNLASHEFRTPISVLQSSVDIMGIYLMQLDNPALKEQFEKHINVIQEELTRLKEILENILNVGRINTGAIRINHEECDVVDLIYKIIDGITLAAGARGMLKVTVLGEPIAVQIDRLLFSNVIRNIISNALKYSSGKQAPEVTISFLPESFVVSVQDFGIGIPEEEQPHLFTSFFRASNTSGIPGTGLGLVLAKQFLEMQGGTIALESSVGKGCVVKLTLPVKANRDDESTGN